MDDYRRGRPTSAARAIPRESRRDLPAHVEEFTPEQAELVLDLRQHYSDVKGRESIVPEVALLQVVRSGVPIYYHPDDPRPRAKQESHGRDAYEISDMAPPELKIPMIFHDVGKAGPDANNRPQSELYTQLYAYEFNYEDRFPDQVPVIEVIESMLGIPEKAKQMATMFPELIEHGGAINKKEFAMHLFLLLDLPQDAHMRDFYNVHIKNGVELSKNIPVMDKQDQFAGFGHHILYGNVPIIEGFTPGLEDIMRAAGAQALDFCNARFTRLDFSNARQNKLGISEGQPAMDMGGERVNTIITAVAQTREALGVKVNGNGYDELEEAYNITVTDKIREAVLAYIDTILDEYQSAMIAKGI